MLRANSSGVRLPNLFVRPLLVVFLYPCVNDGANLTEPAKNIEVQYLLAEGAVGPSTYEFCVGLPG